MVSSFDFFISVECRMPDEKIKKCQIIYFQMYKQFLLI
jgi:hypothetical protein